MFIDDLSAEEFNQKARAELERLGYTLWLWEKPLAIFIKDQIRLELNIYYRRARMYYKVSDNLTVVSNDVNIFLGDQGIPRIEKELMQFIQKNK